MINSKQKKTDPNIKSSEDDEELRYVQGLYTDIDINILIKALLTQHGYEKNIDGCVSKSNEGEDPNDAACCYILGAVAEDGLGNIVDTLGKVIDKDNLPLILIPYQIPGHWVTIMLTYQNKKFYLDMYNSLGSDDKTRSWVLGSLEQILNEQGYVSETKEATDNRIQYNNVYCGGYTAHCIVNFAINFLSSEPKNLFEVVELSVFKKLDDDTKHRQVDANIVKEFHAEKYPEYAIPINDSEAKKWHDLLSQDVAEQWYDDAFKQRWQALDSVFKDEAANYIIERGRGQFSKYKKDEVNTLDIVNLFLEMKDYFCELSCTQDSNPFTIFFEPVIDNQNTKVVNDISLAYFLEHHILSFLTPQTNEGENFTEQLNATPKSLHHQQIQSNEKSQAQWFYQGPYLKPGYRGTEYQIVTLIVKWLESLNNQKESHALMEVANAGVLDDMVIVNYDDNFNPATVTAFQIKYYEKPIGKSDLEPGGSIGIDQLFIGYLALKHQFNNAELIAGLYTNTTLSDNLSTQDSKVGYQTISENWEEACKTFAVNYSVSIPKTLFSGHRSFANYLGNGRQSPIKKSQLDKLLAEKLRIGKQTEFPELIDKDDQITGDIEAVTPEQWNKLSQHYKNHILRSGKQPSLSAEGFVSHIKSILKEKQEYNNNLTMALSQYKDKEETEQKQIAQAFLNELRLYIQQPTFEEQYNNGIELLANVRQVSDRETITTEQKNELVFAYIFNQVRLWFTKTYAHHKVPTLNREWLANELVQVTQDEQLWQEFGASNELVNAIYDKINNQLIERKAPQETILRTMNSDVKMVILHGKAGSGKSVLAKFYWQHWKSAKFFLDTHQSNIVTRRNNIQSILNHLPRTLIVIDRVERINGLGDWGEFFKACKEGNHQILFVTREPDIIKTELNINKTIEVPSFTKDELAQLKLPDFVTKNPGLSELCRLPFFCRLAFDIDSREYREINRSNFVELAIEGVYSDKTIKKEKRLVWQALCLRMLQQKQGHSAIEVPERIKERLAFEKLVKKEILLIEESRTASLKVKFMHDLFFEIGLESILTRSIETDLVNISVRAFSQRLTLCLTHLSQYNVNLLLPWLNQHQTELRQLYQEPDDFLTEIQDDAKRLLLALLITEEPTFFKNIWDEPSVNHLNIEPLFQGRHKPLISLSIFFKHKSAFQICSKLNALNFEETLSDCFESLSYWDAPISKTDTHFLIDIIAWIDEISPEQSIDKSILHEGLKLICPKLVSFQFLKKFAYTNQLNGLYPITFDEFMQDEEIEDIRFYHYTLGKNWVEWLYEFDNFAQLYNQNNIEPIDLSDFIAQLMAVIDKTDYSFKDLNEQAIVEILLESQPPILESNDAEEITDFIDDAGLSEDSLTELFGEQIRTEYEAMSDDNNVIMGLDHIIGPPWNLSVVCALDTVDVSDEALNWLYDNGYSEDLKEYFDKNGNKDEFFPNEENDRIMLIEAPDFVFLRSGRYIADNAHFILSELEQLNAEQCIELIKAHFPQLINQSEDNYSDDGYNSDYNSSGFFSGSRSQSSKSESEEGYDYNEYSSNENSM